MDEWAVLIADFGLKVCSRSPVSRARDTVLRSTLRNTCDIVASPYSHTARYIT